LVATPFAISFFFHFAATVHVEFLRKFSPSSPVIAAKGETEDARLALSELCEAFYDPVVGFLRKEGRSKDEARELAHDFFAWLLARGRRKGKGK